MTITKPTLQSIFSSLLIADFSVQRRRGRSVIMSFLIPLVLLFAWKNIAQLVGGQLVIASCISIGLISVGLVGYSTSLAQDRGTGVFQRLRATPAPTWTIMVSRLVVQLATITLMAILVIIGGFYIDSVKTTLPHAVLTIIAALFSGAVFLSLGQVIVAFTKSADAVNSAGRLLYAVFTFSGIFASFANLGTTITNIINWSPYGVVQSILKAALGTQAWTGHDFGSLAACLGYILVFAAIGIRYFQWGTE